MSDNEFGQVVPFRARLDKGGAGVRPRVSPPQRHRPRSPHEVQRDVEQAVNYPSYHWYSEQPAVLAVLAENAVTAQELVDCLRAEMQDKKRYGELLTKIADPALGHVARTLDHLHHVDMVYGRMVVAEMRSGEPIDQEFIRHMRQQLLKCGMDEKASQAMFDEAKTRALAAMQEPEAPTPPPPPPLPFRGR